MNVPYSPPPFTGQARALWHRAINGIAALWIRVVNIGLTPELSTWQQKRIRLVNGIASFSLVIFPLYLLSLINSPDYVTFWLVIIIMALTGSVLILSYFRFYNAAVWYFLLVGTVFYAFDTLAKKHDGAEYTLITYGLAGMMFFRDYRVICFYFLLNLSLFFWVRHAQTVIPPFLYIREMTDLYNTNTFTSIVGMFAVVYYFKSDNMQQEALLQQQNEQLQTSLLELSTLQTQLIQREKLASLGELTAGIAHEIQNPLNFVNNFAELSGELLTELTDEQAKGPAANPELARELVTDLHHNIGKIYEHGQRAASIVRGMLNHSRASSGRQELTDLNALCLEYLQLSFDSFRAKNQSFLPCYQTDFDPTLPRLSVAQQDIGRVVFNLLSNAFYTVSERAKRQETAYEPSVTVSTRLVAAPTFAPEGSTPAQSTGLRTPGSRHIEIRVRDNGLGMTSEVCSKVFQPFFTTKPTGSGTGLGLSLSYDIVTKGHNGTLTVQSEPGQGAEFVIVLPYLTPNPLSY